MIRKENTKREYRSSGHWLDLHSGSDIGYISISYNCAVTTRRPTIEFNLGNRLVAEANRSPGYCLQSCTDPKKGK